MVYQLKKEKLYKLYNITCGKNEKPQIPAIFLYQINRVLVKQNFFITLENPSFKAESEIYGMED